MKPNFRNLPSLVNFKQQSVSVPKAANSFRKRSSFIWETRNRKRGQQQDITTEMLCGHIQTNALTNNGLLKKYITLYRGRAGKKQKSTMKALHLPTNSLHAYICASKSSPLKRCTQVGGCPQSSTHCNHRQLPTPPHEAPGPQHPNHQGSCPQHSLTFSSQAEDSLCQDTESENH